MNFRDVIAATSSYQSIAIFVTGDSFAAAVTDLIGDIHLKAAITSLRQQKISNDPEWRIKSAIIHLEAANSAFETQLAKTGFLSELLESGYLMRTARKNVYACSLLSLCHFHFDDYGMVKDYLERGENGILYTYHMPHIESYMAEQDRYVKSMTKRALDPYTASRAAADRAGSAAMGELLTRWSIRGVMAISFFGNPKNWPLLKLSEDYFRDVEKEFAIFKQQMLRLIESAQQVPKVD